MTTWYSFGKTNGIGDMITDYSGSFVCGISGSSVYTSNDAGSNWNLTSTLPYGIGKMPYRYFTNYDSSLIIVNRDLGYFYSTNKGVSWTQNLIIWPVDITSPQYLTLPTVSDNDGVNLATSILNLFEGAIFIKSHNGGATWTTTRTIGEPTGLAYSKDGGRLYLTVGASVYVSTNSGDSFSLLNTFAISAAEKSLSCSGDGATVVLCVDTGGLFISYDYGSTWSQITYSGFTFWNDPISISYDGLVIMNYANYGIDNYIAISRDGGITWGLVLPTTTFYNISETYHACSGNGERMYTRTSIGLGITEESIYRWPSNASRTKIIWWN